MVEAAHLLLKMGIGWRTSEGFDEVPQTVHQVKES